MPRTLPEQLVRFCNHFREFLSAEIWNNKSRPLSSFEDSLSCFQKDFYRTSAIRLIDGQGRILHAYNQHQKLTGDDSALHVSELFLDTLTHAVRDKTLVQSLVCNLHQAGCCYNGRGALTLAGYPLGLYPDDFEHTFDIRVHSKGLLIEETISIKKMKLSERYLEIAVRPQKHSPWLEPLTEQEKVTALGRYRRAVDRLKYDSLATLAVVEDENGGIFLENNHGILTIKVCYQIESGSALALQVKSEAHSYYPISLLGYQVTALNATFADVFWGAMIPLSADAMSQLPALKLRIVGHKTALLEVDFTGPDQLCSCEPWLKKLLEMGIDQVYLWDKATVSKTLATRPLMLAIERDLISRGFSIAGFVYPIEDSLPLLSSGRSYNSARRKVEQCLNNPAYAQVFEQWLKQQVGYMDSTECRGKLEMLVDQYQERISEMFRSGFWSTGTQTWLNPEEAVVGWPLTAALATATGAVNLTKLVRCCRLFVQLVAMEAILFGRDVGAVAKNLSKASRDYLETLRKQYQSSHAQDPDTIALKSFLCRVASASFKRHPIYLLGYDTKHGQAVVDSQIQMAQGTDTTKVLIEWGKDNYCREVMQRRKQDSIPRQLIAEAFELGIEDLKVHLGQAIKRIGRHHKKTQLLQRFIDECCQSEQVKGFLESVQVGDGSQYTASNLNGLWQRFIQRVYIDVHSDEECCRLPRQVLSLVDILRLHRPLFVSKLSRFSDKTKSYQNLLGWQGPLRRNLISCYNRYVERENRPDLYSNDAILELTLGRLMEDSTASSQQRFSHRAEMWRRLQQRPNHHGFMGPSVVRKLEDLLKEAQNTLADQPEKQQAIKQYRYGLKQWLGTLDGPVTISEIQQKLSDVQQTIQRAPVWKEHRPWWRRWLGLGAKNSSKDRLITELKHLRQYVQQQKSVLEQLAQCSVVPSLGTGSDFSMSNETYGGYVANHTTTKSSDEQRPQQAVRRQRGNDNGRVQSATMNFFGDERPAVESQDETDLDEHKKHSVPQVA